MHTSFGSQVDAFLRVFCPQFSEFLLGGFGWTFRLYFGINALQKKLDSVPLGPCEQSISEAALVSTSLHRALYCDTTHAHASHRR